MGSYISSWSPKENELHLPECSKFRKARLHQIIVCLSVIGILLFHICYIFASAVRVLTYLYTMQYEKWLDFDSNPLYALMHESIYCQVKLLLVGYSKVTGLLLS